MIHRLNTKKNHFHTNAIIAPKYFFFKYLIFEITCEWNKILRILELKKFRRFLRTNSISKGLLTKNDVINKVL